MLPGLGLCGGLIVMLAMAAQAQELSNGTLSLRLNVTPEGVPVIEEGVWQSTGATVFRDMGTPEGLRAWLPAPLTPGSPGSHTDMEYYRR